MTQTCSIPAPSYVERVNQTIQTLGRLPLGYNPQAKELQITGKDGSIWRLTQSEAILTAEAILNLVGKPRATVRMPGRGGARALRPSAKHS